MPAGRPPLPLETWGKITRTTRDGRPAAVARFRDSDGKARLVQRTGRTLADAERRLLSALHDRAPQVDFALSKDSLLGVLADQWLETVRREKRATATVAKYTATVDNHVRPGVFGHRRSEIRVDLMAAEGLARAATELPHRMKPSSRLDWTFPTFLTFFPSGRGRERTVDVMRVMRPSEQLRFEFGAYSRVSGTPSVAIKQHRVGLLGFPLRGGPWTRIVKYSSLWDALTSPACPDSLKGWFLEWLECRTDFQQRLAEDESGKIRLDFHQVVTWLYWPPGAVAVGRQSVRFGDPENDAKRHRLTRTFFALPDMTPIDPGRVVSGPGGSSEFSQVRMVLAMSLLTGSVSPGSVNPASSLWILGLGNDDPIVCSAAEARRLHHLGKRKPLSRQESNALAGHLSAVSLELARCTYAPVAHCEREVVTALEASDPA